MKKKSIFCTVLIIYSCNINTSNYSAGKGDVASLLWAKDSLGCLNYRNKEIGERLIEQYSIINGSAQRLLKIFGKPNSIDSNGNHKRYIYLYGQICADGKVIKESDSCWVEFDVVDDKVIEVTFGCT